MTTPIVYNSVSELNKVLGLPAPQHPLITLNNYADMKVDIAELPRAIVLNMYKISFKFNFTGRIKYGQHYYDFDAGGMVFAAPMQMITAVDNEGDYSGYSLVIHPDYLRNSTLGKTIKDYGFFSYSVNEALHLSEQEKAIISGIFENIKTELASSIDNYSHSIILSQIEQLLSYSNRFYNRQFITRKAVHHDLVTQLDDLLNNYFDRDEALFKGIPAVQEIAAQLNVSQRYLSDMLGSLTGQNTRQYIQLKMIEKAKELLSTSTLTIAQIAYQLGFEYPQSFNKLFRKKTNTSPLEFRQSFN
jgi:AraC family transcriptional regulator, transcriptional activator of pobA